jgi:hypothetical protein
LILGSVLLVRRFAEVEVDRAKVRGIPKARRMVAHRPVQLDLLGRLGREVLLEGRVEVVEAEVAVEF